MTTMVNGVLAAAMRQMIDYEDLAIKEVAAKIKRGETVVYRILRGEKVSRRTMAQVARAFPKVFE